MIAHTVTVTAEGDDVAELRFQSAHPHNPLSIGLLHDLHDAIVGLASAPPRVVIVAGGDSAFTGGAHVDELAALDADDLVALVAFELALFRALEQLPSLTIAAVRGACVGNGVEVALACDVRIAADDLKLAIPEVRLGYPAPVQRLCRYVPLGAAKELVLTGRTLGAAEALRLGLVTQVVPIAELDTVVSELAERYRRYAPAAVSATKRLIDRAALFDLDMDSEILAEAAAILTPAS